MAVGLRNRPDQDYDLSSQDKEKAEDFSDKISEVRDPGDLLGKDSSLFDHDKKVEEFGNQLQDVRGVDDLLGNNSGLLDSEKKAGDQNVADTEKSKSGSASDELSDQEQSSGGWGVSEAIRNYAANQTGQSKSTPLPALIISLILMAAFGSSLIVLQSLPLNLLNNLFNANNSSEVASSIRQRKVMKFIMGADDPTSICASSAMKCKNGKISHKALNKMARHGIIADGYDGTTKQGYPDGGNPKGYTYTDPETGKMTHVSAADFDKAMTDNPKFARKVFGVKGAFNMRVNVLMGKHLTRIMFNRLGLSRGGGSAAESAKKHTPLKNAISKVKAKLKFPKVDGIVAKFNSIVNKKMKGIKKGGAAFAAAAGACMILKVPDIVIAGSTALDIAFVTGAVTQGLLSPSAKGMTTFYHEDFTTYDSENIGGLLAHQVVNEKGEKRAGIDSPHLLFAAGISRIKPAISKLSPGYGALKNPAISAAKVAQDATEDQCDYILSPAALMAAMVGSSVIAAASATTLVGLAAKIAIDWAVGEAVSIAIVAAGTALINLSIDTLKQEEVYEKAIDDLGAPYGEVMGVGAAAVMAAAGMANHLPVLTTNQIVAYSSMKRDLENEKREEAIATLSPFDISSKYTFLGSLAHNFQNSAILSGYYSNPNLASFASGLISMASTALSTPSASAAAADNYEKDRCSYAEEWGIPKTDLGETPAIQFNGLPCTGPTELFLTMETSEAIDIMSEAGMFNEEVDFNDDDAIDQLLSTTDDSAQLNMSETPANDEGEGGGDPTTEHTGGTNVTKEGYFKPDTPLDIFIRECSDASAGTYLIDSAGCTLEKTAEITQRVMTAISVFLFDYILIKSINGENDDEGAQSADALSHSEASVPAGDPGVCPEGTKNYGIQDGYERGVKKEITTCGIIDWPSNFANSAGERVVEVNSTIAAQTAAMAAALKAHSQANGNYPYVASLGFRTHEQQACIRKHYETGVKGCSPYNSKPPAAAREGYSNHQMGLSIDLPTGYNCSSPYYKVSIKANKWLDLNMSKYGFKRDVGCGDYGHFTNKGGVSGL